MRVYRFAVFRRSRLVVLEYTCTSPSASKAPRFPSKRPQPMLRRAIFSTWLVLLLPDFFSISKKQPVHFAANSCCFCLGWLAAAPTCPSKRVSRETKNNIDSRLSIGDPSREPTLCSADANLESFHLGPCVPERAVRGFVVRSRRGPGEIVWAKKDLKTGPQN